MLPIFLLALGASLMQSGCAGKKTAAATDSAAELAGSGGETLPLVGNYKVTRFTLSNGLRLLVAEDHSSPTFAYQTWFRVGSRDELPGRTGLAHLFEHMMFKGTVTIKEGEFDHLLEGAGVEGENAFTNRDYTAYIEELPREQLDLVARLESDRMVNLVVDDQSFKTELEVVQNERRFRNENSPDGLMYQELFDQAFAKHPYHWPVIGYTADLNAMTSADARNFYKAYYSPNHATVVVAGDVNPGQVLATVKKYHGALPSSNTPPHEVTPEPPQAEPRRKNLKLNIQVDKLLLGWHIPALSDNDVPAIEQMRNILTGGKSSRLSRALVETGIASSVESEDLDDKDPSLFLIWVNMQKGKHAAQAEAVIEREIARLQREQAGAREMERARNLANFDFYEDLTNDYKRAQFLGHYDALAGNFEFGVALQAKLQAVTPLDVMTVAKRYLVPKNRTSITGLPK